MGFAELSSHSLGTNFWIAGTSRFDEAPDFRSKFLMVLVFGLPVQADSVETRFPVGISFEAVLLCAFPHGDAV